MNAGMAQGRVLAIVLSVGAVSVASACDSAERKYAAAEDRDGGPVQGGKPTPEHREDAATSGDPTHDASQNTKPRPSSGQADAAQTGTAQANSETPPGVGSSTQTHIPNEADAGPGASATDNPVVTPPSAPSCVPGEGDSLTIDATQWVSTQCNAFGIQGAYYCFGDGVAETDCDDNVYDADRDGICLAGETIEDPTFAAWGAGVGLSLNRLSSSMNGPYDAQAAGLIGFSIVVRGTTGGNALHIDFQGDWDASSNGYVSPFVEYPGIDASGASRFNTLFADALVPGEWDVPNAGARIDPTAVTDLHVQIVGGQRDAAYDFCVTEITPILETFESD